MKKKILISVLFFIFLLSCISGYFIYNYISRDTVAKVRGVTDDISYVSEIDTIKEYLDNKYEKDFIFTGLNTDENDIIEYHYSVSDNPRLRISATYNKDTSIFDKDAIKDTLPDVLKFNAKSSYFGMGITEITEENYIDIAEQIISCLNQLCSDYKEFNIDIVQYHPEIYLTLIDSRNKFISVPFIYGESLEGIEKYFTEYIL